MFSLGNQTRFSSGPMVRDANAHPTIYLHAALAIYSARAYRAEVYLYPTRVQRKGCESLIVTSNRHWRNLEQRPSDVDIHTPSRTPPSSQCGSRAGEHPPVFIWTRTLHGLPLPLPLPIDKLGCGMWGAD